MGNTLHACSAPLEACGYSNDKWPTSTTLPRQGGEGQQQPVSARDLKHTVGSPAQQQPNFGWKLRNGGNQPHATSPQTPGAETDDFWDETTRYQGPLTEDDNDATEHDLLTERSEYDNSEMISATPRSRRQVSWREDRHDGKLDRRSHTGSTTRDSQDTWDVHEREDTTVATWSKLSSTGGGNALRGGLAYNSREEEERRRLAAKSRRFLRKWDAKHTRSTALGRTEEHS